MAIKRQQSSRRSHKKKARVKLTTLKNKADALFSKCVRLIGYCEAKGKDDIKCGGNLQCCHIKTRGRHHLRFKFQNAICMCAGHHVWYTYNNDAWEKFVQEHFPEKWSFVEEQSQVTHKITEEEYRIMIDTFERILTPPGKALNII